MASSGSTKVTIPEELKPLYRSTAGYMTGLQNFLWGGNQYDFGEDASSDGGQGRQVRRRLSRSPNVMPYGFYQPISQERTINPSITGFSLGRRLTREPVPGEPSPDERPPGQPSPEHPLPSEPEEPPEPGTGGDAGRRNPYRFDPNNLPLVLQFTPREIADISANPFIQSSFVQAYNLGEMSPWELEGLGVARETVPAAEQRLSGFSISEQNPLVQAQKNAFMASILPEIQNQMAMAGLGRSSAAADAVANAWAQMLPGIFESELGREERRIERGLGARQGLANYLAGAGGQYFQRQQSRYGALRDVGDWYQNYLQSRADARNEELRRLQGIAENALFTPLGGFVPSTFGAKTRSK